MNAKLRQARDAQRRTIDENPVVVTYERAALVDDGMGGMIPDPFGAKTTGLARVRIAHESGSVQGLSPSPAGLSANLSLFVTMDHSLPIQEGDVIYDQDDQGWTVGVINKDRRFGGVVGASATLEKADVVPVTPPTELEAAAISSSAIDLAWTDIGAGNSYSVERSANGTTGWAVIGTAAAGARVYHDTGLTASTTYYYRIRAVCGSRYSLYTEVAHAGTSV